MVSKKPLGSVVFSIWFLGVLSSWEPFWNVLALSDMMYSGIPLLHTNCLKALTNKLVVWSSTISRCIACSAVQVKRQMYTLTTSFLSLWMYNGYILYLLMSSGSFFCRACRRLFKRFFATVKFVGRFCLTSLHGSLTLYLLVSWLNMMVSWKCFWVSVVLFSSNSSGNLLTS